MAHEKYFPHAGGVFSALGTSDADNQGRSSGNLGKLFYDTGGKLYKLMQNGETTSRPQFAPTIQDNNVSSPLAQTGIQPAASRLHQFAGVWADAVGASSATDGTLRQMVLYRGVALTAPLETGRTHPTTGIAAVLLPGAGVDDFVSESAAATALSDVHGWRVGWNLGVTLATDAATAQLLLGLPAL